MCLLTLNDFYNFNHKWGVNSSVSEMLSGCWSTMLRLRVSACLQLQNGLLALLLAITVKLHPLEGFWSPSSMLAVLICHDNLKCTVPWWDCNWPLEIEASSIRVKNPIPSAGVPCPPCTDSSPKFPLCTNPSPPKVPLQALISWVSSQLLLPLLIYCTKPWIRALMSILLSWSFNIIEINVNDQLLFYNFLVWPEIQNLLYRKKVLLCLSWLGLCQLDPS